MSTQPLDTYVVNVRPAKGQKPSARIHVAYSANTIRALQGVCRNGQKQSFDRPFYTIRRLLAVGPWTPSACQPCKNSESQSKRLALLYRSLSTSIVGFFNNLIFCVRFFAQIISSAWSECKSCPLIAIDWASADLWDKYWLNPIIDICSTMTAVLHKAPSHYS